MCYNIIKEVVVIPPILKGGDNVEQVIILFTSIINLTVAIINLVTVILMKKGKNREKEPSSSDKDESSH